MKSRPFFALRKWGEKVPKWRGGENQLADSFYPKEQPPNDHSGTGLCCRNISESGGKANRKTQEGRKTPAYRPRQGRLLGSALDGSVVRVPGAGGGTAKNGDAWECVCYMPESHKF